ncbi:MULTISPECIES: DUF551 domain-containing protein [unclassified Pasteurella]|uniref:DUF551 domain-containing protein n=1 Tax=unclassified Pasteurella TaxID=2621516 RepID=UPI001073FADF|nr:DUF551 domain-containing protein [Pasteurella sp. 19428wF3_WM03]TFU50452.1 DUF551 domain-containing protein [Pasteurella sp. WM03]
MSENNGWIKCSERLPEKYTGFSLVEQSKLVLVYGRQLKNDPLHIFSAKLYGDDYWLSPFGKCDLVTHWQPIPEKPID